MFDRSDQLHENMVLMRMDCEDRELPPEQLRYFRVSSNWSRIAAYEAVSTIFNFRWSLMTLIKAVKDPIVVPSIPNAGKISEAWLDFEAKFPTLYFLRYAVVHRTDISHKVEVHATRGKGKDSSRMLSMALLGRTLKVSRKGDILTLAITHETFEEIKSIYLLACEAT